MKILYTLLFGFLMSVNSYAQNDFFQTHPLTITFYNHSIGVPFKDYLKFPLNFGIAIGTSFNYSTNTSNSRHQAVQIGFHHHKHLGTSLLLKTDFIQRFNTKDNVWGEISVSAGYLHTFNHYPIYSPDKKGKYSKKRDFGIPSFVFGGGVGAGFQLDDVQDMIWRPFVKYEALLETPYSSFVPIFPHTLFEIGAQIYQE